MRNYYLQRDYCPHFCKYYYNISARDIPRYGQNMRIIYPCRLYKMFSLKFPEGYPD